MDKAHSAMADQVAQAAIDFQQQRTGHAPEAGTVVLNDNTLVVSMHEALTEAENALARSPASPGKVQEFYRILFGLSSAALRREIARITGVKVQESAAEVAPFSGVVVHALTRGTIVQAFQLGQSISQAV